MEDFGTQYIESLLKPCNTILGRDIRAAWLEYEIGEIPKAIWVREIDKFEYLIQAFKYEEKTFRERDLDEFQGLLSKISSLEGRV